PDGDGRGDVRVGRDHRPRSHRDHGHAPGREALDRTADGAGLRARCPPARLVAVGAGRAPPATGHRASGARARPGRGAGRGARGGPRLGRAGHPLRDCRSVARGRLRRPRRPSRGRRARGGARCRRSRRRRGRRVSFEEPLHRIPDAYTRDRNVLVNGWLVARRELRERVRSRLFFVSTALLALLAVAVSLTPVLIKIIDRGTTTSIAIMSDEPHLTQSSISILNTFINPAPPPG